MKHRLPFLLFALLLTAIIFWVQPRIESMEPAPSKANCDRVKQCLQAEFAWPQGMQYCSAVLAPLTVRNRSADGKLFGYSMSYDGCSTAQIITPRFDAAEKFGNNGLAKVSRDGKWGYINLKGEEVVPLSFAEVGDIDYGLIPVKSNNKWGYINAQGHPAVPYKYDAVAGTWRNELSAVQVNKKWGYINPNGEMVIEPRFDKATEFRNGLAQVESGRKWGIVNAAGEVVIPPSFDVIFMTGDSRLLLVALNHRYGYVDNKGNEIIPSRLVKPVRLRYDGSGSVQVKLNEMALSFTDDSEGTDSVPLGGWFYLDAPNEKLRFDEKGKAQLWRNGEWFYISTKGRLVR